ncbi:excitatory amino acid transporter 3-like [Styela clava]
MHKQIKSNLLLILTLLGVVVGVSLGFGVRQLELTSTQIAYLAFPGELFMRALKMIILPLIVSSIICGLAGMDVRLSGKLGLRAILYYMTTTVLAVTTGIVIAVAIQPGSSTAEVGNNGTDVMDNVHEQASAVDSFLDLLRNMLPENIIQATFQQYKTTRIVVVSEENILASNPTGDNSSLVAIAASHTKLEGGYNNGLNVLGIITFSAIFGIFLGRIGKRGEVVTKFFVGFNDVIMNIVSFIMWLSPVGIAFLIAGKIAEVEKLEEIMAKLGLYVVTVLTGTLIHGFITLPALYFVTTRKNPFKFIAGMSQALLTAWATASSSATLPITFKCTEEKNGIDKRVTRFMLPVGATVNMDGGAVYEAVSALFIAQMQGYPIDFGTILTISATATASSVGAAGVPHAALVTIMIVLQACGLPVTDIPLLLAVDWLLDRFRTMVNVFGDAVGTGIVAHLSRKELSSSEYADNSESDESLNSSSPYKKSRDDQITIVDSVSVV